jgi:hypothetical protein
MLENVEVVMQERVYAQTLTTAAHNGAIVERERVTATPLAMLTELAVVEELVMESADQACAAVSTDTVAKEKNTALALLKRAKSPKPKN